MMTGMIEKNYKGLGNAMEYNGFWREHWEICQENPIWKEYCLYLEQVPLLIFIKGITTEADWEIIEIH